MSSLLAARRRACPLIVALAACLALAFAAGCRGAEAAMPGAINLQADSVSFYYDRFLIEADGHVRVSMTDGTVITGRAFSMDLRLNRFVVAGDVTLTAAGKTYPGAGFADFLDFDRQYFVPILQKPDRWTFLDGDYTKPIPGRVMPGDAFALPDVSTDRPFLYAHGVQIVPLNFALFHTARVYAGGLWIPTPRWFQTFSQNPYFAQNALPAAYVTVGLPFNGSATSQSAMVLRYDPTNKLYPAFQQNIVGPNSYLAFAASPLTRPGKQYNLIGLTHTKRFQVRAFLQESVYQPWFSQPLVASAYMNVQPTYALRRSFVQYNADFNYNSILSQPINQEGVGGAYYYLYNGSRFYWLGSHPDDSQLSWLGFENHIGKLPITFRLRSGIGTAHDSITPLGTWNNVGYPSTWTHYVGITLQTSSFPIDRKRDEFFIATYDAQRLWYSQPHYSRQEITTLSLSRLFLNKAALYVAYRVTNQGDIWGGNFQAVQYPVNIPLSPQTNQLYPGFAAFAGKATLRALVGSAVLSPNPNFNFTLTFTRNKDFPQPIPGYYGNPPYSLSGDVRFRAARHISIDVQRTYYFHFGTMNWSPQWTLTVGP